MCPLLCFRNFQDKNISLHGETYHIKVKGSGDTGETERPFYVSVDGISEEVLIETLDELQVSTTGNQTTDKKKTTRHHQQDLLISDNDDPHPKRDPHTKVDVRVPTFSGPPDPIPRPLRTGVLGPPWARRAQPRSSQQRGRYREKEGELQKKAAILFRPRGGAVIKRKH